MASSTWHQYAMEDLTLLLPEANEYITQQRGVGQRMPHSGVIWIPRSRGGVSQPQKSFSLMLTHKASLRDLSIKPQHALQKN